MGEGQANGASPKGPTILIADDEPRDRELLRDLLARQGYCIVEAGSGEEALKVAKEASPGLVILDVVMPDLDGYEVCRRLKQDPETSLIPVVMITAHGDVHRRIQGIEAGADDFLYKPVSALELSVRVRSLLRVKACYDELEEGHRRLRELEGLREKLTSLIIHDLNGPLSTLLFNLSVVLADPEGRLSSQEKSFLQRALQSGEQLAHMVRNLLDISRLEEGRFLIKREPFRMEELVRENLMEIEGQAAAKGIRLTADLPPDLPRVEGDRELLGRILSNLLRNALDYTPSGGSITIAAKLRSGSGVRGQASQRGEKVHGPPPTNDEPHGDFIEIAVRDTGVGIPAAYQEKIFEKFAQIDVNAVKGRRGTGLGLTFCKLAMEAHGGAIWVESQEGKGSTFVLILPIAADDQVRRPSALERGER